MSYVEVRPEPARAAYPPRLGLLAVSAFGPGGAARKADPGGERPRRRPLSGAAGAPAPEPPPAAEEPERRPKGPAPQVRIQPELIDLLQSFAWWWSKGGRSLTLSDALRIVLNWDIPEFAEIREAHRKKLESDRSGQRPAKEG